MGLYSKFLVLAFRFRQNIPTVRCCFGNAAHPVMCHADVSEKHLQPDDVKQLLSAKVWQSFRHTRWNALILSEAEQPCSCPEKHLPLLGPNHGCAEINWVLTARGLLVPGLGQVLSCVLTLLWHQTGIDPFEERVTCFFWVWRWDLIIQYPIGMKASCVTKSLLLRVPRFCIS